MSDSISSLARPIHERFSSELLYFVQHVGARADKEGRRAVLVGGVVRDLMLERPIKDADIMLEAPLDDFVAAVAREFKGELVSHPKFKTFTITVSPTLKVDFVTAREESYTTPAALPTVKVSTIDNDFKRRDFTVNTMACFLNKAKWGQVLDPFFGQHDMQKKWIRVLHPLSFRDDPTRVFRAMRFAARLGFSFEPTTQDLIKSAIKDKLPSLLSPVRRRHEFELVLKEADSLACLELMSQWNLLPFIHKGAVLTDAHRAQIKSAVDYMERLTVWLSGLGSDKAKKILDELEFERATKSALLARLAIS